MEKTDSLQVARDIMKCIMVLEDRFIMEARIEKNTKINIIVLKNEYTGIKRIAGKVANDIELVLDTKPVIRETDYDEICGILSGEKVCSTRGKS